MLLALPLAAAAPVPKSLQVPTDAQRFEGRWECASQDAGRGHLPHRRFLQVSNGLMGMSDDPAKLIANSPFTLDTAASPRQFDVTWKHWRTPQRYIYRFDGEQLVMCHAQDDQPRPTAFEGGDGRFCFVWKRVQDK